MTKQLTHDELHAHIKENGITLVRTTEKYYEIPSGTKLWFGCARGSEMLTFNQGTGNKNKEFNYKFDYEQWWVEGDGGKFELVSEEPKFKFKKGDKVKSTHETNNDRGIGTIIKASGTNLNKEQCYLVSGFSKGDTTDKDGNSSFVEYFLELVKEEPTKFKEGHYYLVDAGFDTIIHIKNGRQIRVSTENTYNKTSTIAEKRRDAGESYYSYDNHFVKHFGEKMPDKNELYKNNNPDYFEAEKHPPHYKQYIGKKYAVHCTTQEDRKRVDEAFDNNRSYEPYNTYKERLCLSCDDDFAYCSIEHFEKDKDYTILTTAQFFGEEELPGAVAEGVTEDDIKTVDGPYYNKYIGKRYAVKCETQREWDMAITALESVSFKWHTGENPYKYKGVFNKRVRHCYLCIEESGAFKRETSGDLPKDYKTITIDQFLYKNENIKIVSKDDEYMRHYRRARERGASNIFIDEVAHTTEELGKFIPEQPFDGISNRTEKYQKLMDDTLNQMLENQNPCREHWVFKELIKNNNKTTMETLKEGIIELTKDVKTFLQRISPEFRDLYRAGYVNKDLTFTTKYTDKRDEILNEQVREAITKEATQEIKDAEKEAKKKK